MDTDQARARAEKLHELNRLDRVPETKSCGGKIGVALAPNNARAVHFWQQWPVEDFGKEVLR